jgi:hypothetical protein
VRAEREHTTHGLAFSACGAGMLICLWRLLRQAEKEDDVAVVLELRGFYQFEKLLRRQSPRKENLQKE